jgi:hypothetical protein
MAKSLSLVTPWKKRRCHEEDVADAEAMSPSAVKSPAPTTSTADADDAAKGIPEYSNDGRSPNRAIGDSNSHRDEADLP